MTIAFNEKLKSDTIEGDFDVDGEIVLYQPDESIKLEVRIDELSRNS